MHAVLVAAVYSLLQAAFLGSTPGALRSHDAVVQKVALKQLQRVLSFRQAFGETVVQKLAEADILDALVAVLQPGTDACKLDVLPGVFGSLSLTHPSPALSGYSRQTSGALGIWPLCFTATASAVTHAAV